MNARYIAELAARNLWRHRRRTTITAAAVAVGLSMFILIDSLLVGAEEESNRNLIWYETGAAQVIHDAYLAERDDRPLRYVIENPEEIEARLEETGLSTTQRTVFSAELIVFRDPFPEDGSVVVTAYGIDPDDDAEVYRLPDALESGTFIEAGENRALIGAWLAEDIGAEVGYPITLVTRTRDGYFQTIDLEIAGILRTPNPIVNRSAVFLPLDLANTYLQMERAVTEISVASLPGASLPELTDVMQQRLAGIADISVADWRALAADAVALVEAKDAGSGVIIFLVFVIAAIGISNTILMSIIERTRELGMMRAMGMRNREITVTLLAEAAGIGLIGGLIGLAGGAAVTLYLVEVGIDYGPILRDMDVGYRLAGRLYGVWNPAAFVQALVVGIVISVATAAVPVRRALRMSVIDSLRS